MELLSSSYEKKRNREFGIQEMGESFLKLTTESPTTDINMSKRSLASLITRLDRQNIKEHKIKS